jgi:hypothetical protein
VKPSYSIHKAEGGYHITFHYDPGMVKRIKCVPGHARKWDPDLKAWWVKEDWLDRACKLLDDVNFDPDDPWTYPGNQDGYRPQQENRAQSPPNVPDCCRTLYLQPDAPEEIIRAAARAMMRKTHPDTGGDKETFIRVERAYEACLARIGKEK